MTPLNAMARSRWHYTHPAYRVLRDTTEMSSEALLRELPGGDELCDWFGRAPSFHDAEIVDISLSSSGASTIKVHAWNISDEVDERGYFKTRDHAIVKIALVGVRKIQLEHFSKVGIVSEFSVVRQGRYVQVAWTGSYGVEGEVCAKGVEFQTAAWEKATLSG